MACTRVGAYCIRPIAWPVTVCERIMHHLRSVVAVCETTMQHLRGAVAVCERIMHHLRSVAAVCEATMHHLHSVVAVCETTMQHLRSLAAVCETTMQHLRSVVAVCEAIMQHLHSPFAMCAPTTGTIIHPCEMSGGRMLLRPYMYPANFAAPAGAAPTRVQSSGPGYPANFAGVRRRPLPIIRDCECVAPQPTFAALFLT